AGANGAASATGAGEAIMKGCLCREAVRLLLQLGAQGAAVRAIGDLYAGTGGEAGLVMVDSTGRLGYAHNAATMEIAVFAPPGDIRHVIVEPTAKGPNLL
ncbi:MAG: isoaspartyl peptidase/L-asparaginase, partial [Deltaproteobacteria bacterium]|nr:isoaspartyl peptidase/L-asparaginase [Deltaproteobacteria bacterium]